MDLHKLFLQILQILRFKNVHNHTHTQQQHTGSIFSEYFPRLVVFIKHFNSSCHSFAITSHDEH